jgi:hypothetical protein
MSRLSLILVAGLAACSIPNTAFHATPDGGEQTTSHVLAIVPSVRALDVDEGKTADLTVALSQPPTGPVLVRVVPADATAATKIAISTPQLRFDASNFDQPQPITVTGLVDPDAVDALASVTMSADALDPVQVAVTVHDHDVVAIATDIAASGMFTVTELTSSTVHVHLTHQPQGDVRVAVILGAGPITVSPSERVFTAANYDTDQAFTFTAPADANATNETESLTFRATGLADRLYTLVDLDIDTVNISATPRNAISVNEGGSKVLSVSLTNQPTGSVTVNVAVQNGNVTVDPIAVTFTPANYATAQVVTVSAPQDLNTVNETDQITLSATGLTSVSINVTTIDDDVQAILEDAPNPLSVAEDATGKFGVTLKFQPTTTMTVVVSSKDLNVASASPGTLTFTPQNYADATVHQVTVTGTHDNNLATDLTSILLHEPTLVDVTAPVSVTDVDRQAIVLSTTALNIPEGTSGTFSAKLGFDPGTTVTLTVADTNPTSLPIDKTQLTFTGGAGGTWATPQVITVSPPIDTNNVSETATITLSGGGAAAQALTATVMDTTVVTTYGWPAPPPFQGAVSLRVSSVNAYKVHIASSMLDTYGIYVPAAAGDFRMALYADNGNQPGTLVGVQTAQFAARTLVNGVNIVDIPDVAIADGDYWIAMRFSATTNVAATATTPPTLGRRCAADFDIVGLANNWPVNFGTSTCADFNLLNIWVTTYHQ